MSATEELVTKITVGRNNLLMRRSNLSGSLEDHRVIWLLSPSTAPPSRLKNNITDGNVLPNTTKQQQKKTCTDHTPISQQRFFAVKQATRKKYSIHKLSLKKYACCTEVEDTHLWYFYQLILSYATVTQGTGEDRQWQGGWRFFYLLQRIRESESNLFVSGHTYNWRHMSGIGKKCVS